MNVRILTDVSETKSLGKKPRFVMDESEIESSTSIVNKFLSRKERAIRHKQGSLDNKIIAAH